MSRWFRHYAGMMRDEKLVSAAVRSKQPIERVVWIWGAILESAAEINDDGKFSLDTAEIAYFLRAEQADLDRVVGILEELGRIAGNRVVKWGDRQFSSDRSADRTRAYRERQKGTPDVDQNVTAGGDAVTVDRGDADVTSQRRHRDAPETETETETETEKKKDLRAVAAATRPAVDAEFQKFWSEYPKRDGANPRKQAEKIFRSVVKSGTEIEIIMRGVRGYRRELAGKKQIGGPYVAQAVTWLRQQRWTDYQHDPPSAPLPEVFMAEPGSGQFQAWRTYYRDQGRKNMVQQMDDAQEWRKAFQVRSEWPPGHVVEHAQAAE